MGWRSGAVWWVMSPDHFRTAGVSSFVYIHLLVFAGKKLFGPGYSGLEYDYRGLTRLYAKTSNFEKVMQYHNILTQWSQMREKTSGPVDILEYLANCHSENTTMEIVDTFFKMDSHQSCIGSGPSRDDAKRPAVK